MKHLTWRGAWSASIPTDLVAAAGYAGLVAAVFFLPVESTVARTLVGAPLLFFLPGYVAVAAAFPGRRPRAADGATGALARATTSASTRGFTWLERAALAFGVSVAVVPVLALGVSLALGGFTPASTVVALVGFVVVGAVVAVARRLQLPAEERYRSPHAAWAADLHAAIFDADSAVDALVTAALVASVLLAVSTMAYAMAAPQEGEGYSSLGLYTENESGDLVASGYPSNVTADDPAELVAAVENHEHRRVDYTLAVEFQRVADDGTVTRDAVVRRTGLALAPNESWTRPLALASPFAGDSLRLTVFLYRGDAPADPSADSAYRRAFVWLDVTAGNATASPGNATAANATAATTPGNASVDNATGANATAGDATAGNATAGNTTATGNATGGNATADATDAGNISAGGNASAATATVAGTATAGTTTGASVARALPSHASRSNHLPSARFSAGPA